MQFYVAVLLGCLIYIGFQLNSAFTLPDFRWFIFFKTNIIPVVLNLLIGFALVLMRNDLVNIYPITMFTALCLGFAGQGIFKKIQDTFDKDTQTYIGFK